MANKIPQPGVEVTQAQRTASNNIFSPDLVPFVTGPAKEIINVFDASGALNPNALQGSYIQLPKTISQTSFPSPRGNISEVAVEKSTIRTFFDFSGDITELPRDPGESFLTNWNNAQRAVLRSDVQPIGGWDLNPNTGAKTLQFVVDQPIRNLVTADKAVTFTSIANATLTTQQVCDQINTAWGATIALPVTLTGDARARVQIASNKYGATSSVTIRAGGDANVVLGWLVNEQRIEAAGFRGQDQNDGSTLTPYIEYYRGDYLQDAVSTAFIGGGTGVKYGQSDENGTFTNGKVSAITFTGAGIDLRVGDLMYVDGVRVNNGYVSKVEDTRIKIGTLNTTLSTFDSNGKLLTAVYDQTKVKTLFDPVPFAPRYAWFQARNLTYPVAGNTAAILTGTNAGTAATPATVLGALAIADFGLAGLTLKYTLTIDDVEQNETTITFTGVLANTGAVASFINGLDTNIFASDAGGGDAGKLKIVTVKTGKTQKIKIGAGTANTKLKFDTYVNTTFVGKDVEFVAQPATMVTASSTFAMTIAAGDSISIQVSNDNHATNTTIAYTWAGGANWAAIGNALTDLNTNVAGTAPNNIEWFNSSGKIGVRSKTYTGKTAAIRITTPFVGADQDAIGALKLNFTNTQSGVGWNGIAGETLRFKLNDRTKIYNVPFITNSLVDAITEINNSVGFPVASPVAGSLDKLVITSPLKGQASKVQVLNDTAGTQSAIAFGFVPSNDIARGTGRPNPDFYLDTAGSVVLGGEILRHIVTGYPFDPATAKIYIQYRGLRKDVSPAAKKPGLLRIANLETLEAVLSPITEENPLALAMYFQILNAPDTLCVGLGVDEITDAEPEGTVEAYQRVADFIQAHEIYAIAPLTYSEAVHSVFKTHVDDMSLPKKKGERIVFITPKVPVRHNDLVIATGIAANSIIGQSNKLVLDVNPTVALLQAGINPALAIPYSDQLFVTVTVAGDTRNYNVSAVNGVVIDLNPTFGPTENLDDFFSDTALTEIVTNSSWGMYVRGDLLLIPGSTLVDKNEIAVTVNEKALQYLDKRVYYVFPETVTAPIGGLSKNIPAYYAAAAYTGIKGYQKPQQGLTNFKINGFTNVVNTRGYFNRDQLDTIAGGGVFILINDADGLPIYSRHQLSTNVTTVEMQELSITSIVDHAAKLIRNLLRQFIGTNNVTPEIMDAIGTLLDGIRKFLVEDLRSLTDMRVEKIEQDDLHPDTIYVDIKVKVPYPLNYIKVTIFI